MTEWIPIKNAVSNNRNLVRFQKLSGDRSRIVVHESVIKDAGMKLGQKVDVMFDSVTKPTKMRVCSGSEHLLKRDPQAVNNNNGAIDLKLGFERPNASNDSIASGGVIDVTL